MEKPPGLHCNEDSEHDCDHFAEVYREAVAAINARREREVHIVQLIFDYASCPRCLAEALAEIAGRLDDGYGTNVAAQAAFRELYDLEETDPQLYPTGTAPETNHETQPTQFPPAAGDIDLDAASFDTMWTGFTTVDVDTGADHEHDNFAWTYRIAQLLVEGIEEKRNDKLERALKGAGAVCRTCLAEAIASLALGLVYGQDPSSAARVMLEERMAGDYEPVLQPRQSLAQDDSQFDVEDWPKDS